MGATFRLGSCLVLAGEGGPEDGRSDEGEGETSASYTAAKDDEEEEEVGTLVMLLMLCERWAVAGGSVTEVGGGDRLASGIGQPNVRIAARIPARPSGGAAVSISRSC